MNDPLMDFEGRLAWEVNYFRTQVKDRKTPRQRACADIVVLLEDLGGPHRYCNFFDLRGYFSVLASFAKDKGARSAYLGAYTAVGELIELTVAA